MRTSLQVFVAVCAFFSSACGAADDEPSLDAIAGTALTAVGALQQSCTPSYGRECTPWVELGCTDYYPGTTTCQLRLYERTCREYTQTYDCRPYYGPLVVEHKRE